jgi:hypothetical protein
MSAKGRMQREDGDPDALQTGVKRLSKFPCEGVPEVSQPSLMHLIYWVFSAVEPPPLRFFPVYSQSGRETGYSHSIINMEYI